MSKFTVVREMDDAEIYLVGDKKVMVCWGFSAGSDLGLHNEYDTEVLVAVWDGKDCEVDDLPYLTDDNWESYCGFDVEADFECGCDWADYTRKTEDVLGEILGK